MKFTTTHIAIVASMILVMTNFGCSTNENELNKVSQQKDITFENNTLIFPSIEKYEEAIDNKELSIIQSKSFASNTFKSLKSKLNNSGESEQLKKEMYGFDPLYGSPIFDVLNENGIIRIGKWIIMVDIANEIVGVITEGDNNLQSDMIARNFSNTAIRWFSTADDVLILLEEGAKSTLNKNQLIKSVEKSADKRNSLISNANRTTSNCTLTENLDSSSNTLKDKKVFFSEAFCVDPYLGCKKWIADAKHVYQKVGIYFSLHSKIKYRGNVACISNAPFAVNTDLSLVGNYSYERRRRFRKNEKKSGTFNERGFSNVLNVRSYEGSRSLKRYSLNSTFTYSRKDNCAEIPGCNVIDPVVTIVLPRISD